MKRREFIGATALIAGLTPALLGKETSVSDPNTKNAWNCAHYSDDKETTILPPGLEKPLTVLQIADSHLSWDDESDAEYLPYSKRMGGGTVTKDRWEHFDTMLQKAKDEKFDLIVLTGDILNYPSATAVRNVLTRLEGVGVPFLYTAGNHDWHYEGMKGTSEELRRTWIEKRLKPLYKGRDPMQSSTLIGGINFVCIDNSTYEIAPEQLTFYRHQAARSEPMILLMHIPLYMPSVNIFSCGHPAWGAATDSFHEIERRPRWSETGCSETTFQFVREVRRSPRLAGILTGHLHQVRTAIEFPCIQYIAPAALTGQFRIVRLSKPDEPS